MATAMLQRQLGVRATVTSAGTATNLGQMTTPDAMATMAERGINMTARQSVGLHPDVVREASVIITMERAHVAEVVALSAGAFSKVFTLPEIVARGDERGARRSGESMQAYLNRLHDGRKAADLVRPAGRGPSDEVADPYGKSRAAYRKCADELEDLTRRFVALAFPTI